MRVYPRGHKYFVSTVTILNQTTKPLVIYPYASAETGGHNGEQPVEIQDPDYSGRQPVIPAGICELFVPGAWVSLGTPRWFGPPARADASIINQTCNAIVGWGSTNCGGIPFKMNSAGWGIYKVGFLPTAWGYAPNTPGLVLFHLGCSTIRIRVGLGTGPDGRCVPTSSPVFPAPPSTNPDDYTAWYKIWRFSELGDDVCNNGYCAEPIYSECEIKPNELLKGCEAKCVRHLINLGDFY